jgi:hypothetical protein
MGVEEAYPVPRSALLYIEARGGDERRSDSDGGGAWSQAGVGWHAASEGVARDGTGLTGAKRRRQPFGVGFGWSKLANEALWARRVAVVQGPVVFAPLERGLSLSPSAAAISFSYVRHPGASPVRIAPKRRAMIKGEITMIKTRNMNKIQDCHTQESTKRYNEITP